MSESRTRTRTYSQGLASQQSSVGGGAWSTLRTWPYLAAQKTVSEGHPFRGSSAGGDVGGPFESWHCHYTRNDSVFLTPAYGLYRYRTRIYADSAYTPQYVVSPLSESQLLAKGTTAITQCRPTAPLAGLGVTIGELREGLPKVVGAGLLKTRVHSLRKIPKRGSEEFLNWEFGWKPLLSDLRKSCRAVIQSDRIISQLVRDSGKLVRRRFAFPLETATSTSDSPSVGYPIMVSPMYSSTGRLRKTVTTQSSVWFSGAFRYFLPDGDDLASKSSRWAMEANRLLGLRPDPELLWQLAPWSWLADWFGNTGDVIANASSMAFDGLVIDYGYTMNHYRELTHKVLSGVVLTSGVSVNLTQSYLREHKRRVRATPFGFGIEWPDFSVRQLAILAALGITRSNH